MKNKTMITSLPIYYAKVCDRIWLLDLPLATIGFFVFLVKQAEEFHPTISYLAASLKINRKSVYKHLKELETCNVISCYEKGTFGHKVISKWAFNHPDKWSVKEVCSVKALSSVENKD